MSKEAAEVLRKARELISDPNRWTQEVYARDEMGRSALGSSLYPLSDAAVCFCSIGAIAKASDESVFDAERGEACGILEEAMGDAAFEFNDTHTHAEVLEAFDKAIAAAEAA